MFSRSATIYDAVYSFKDYEGEADAVRSLVASHAPGSKTLLDVACGTGRHLEHFAAWYDVEGLDLDEGLLGVARARLPETPLHLADMTSFDLNRKFDVVTCLFSSIGYVGTIERLHEAVASMAAHLDRAGVLIVEPWLTPDAWIVGRPHLLAVDEPDLKIARMAMSAREGRLSILEFDYLIGAPGKVEHFTERHEAALFTDAEYRAAFEAGGLTVEHDPQGLIGRGLYIARW